MCTNAVEKILARVTVLSFEDGVEESGGRSWEGGEGAWGCKEGVWTCWSRGHFSLRNDMGFAK